jgi:hypothetical protein
MNKHKNISLGGGKLGILGLSLLISVSPVLSVLAETKKSMCEDKCWVKFDRSVSQSKTNQIDDNNFSEKTAKTARTTCSNDRKNRDAKFDNNCTAEKAKNNTFLRQTIANIGLSLGNGLTQDNVAEAAKKSAVNKNTADNENSDTECWRLKANSLEDYNDCANKVKAAKEKEIDAAERKLIADVLKATGARDDCLDDCAKI